MLKEDWPELQSEMLENSFEILSVVDLRGVKKNKTVCQMKNYFIYLTGPFDKHF